MVCLEVSLVVVWNSIANKKKQHTADKEASTIWTMFFILLRYKNNNKYNVETFYDGITVLGLYIY